MSTRAVYTFIDANSTHHVYKHHDGYPSGAAEFIANTLPHAWPLPRFEADEFGASFIAANKSGAGGIRLTSGYDAHGDLEYRYEISASGKSLRIVAYAATYNRDPVDADKDRVTWEKIFGGGLDAFKKFAAKANA
jgi:hypothetical protein